MNDFYIANSTNKCKAAWSIINAKRKSSSKSMGFGISPDTFNAYFVNVANDLVKDNGSNQLVIDARTRQVPCSFSFENVSCVIVREAIDSLKNKSSSDIYGLSVELLKSVKDILISPLSKLINAVINESVYPSALKLAKVVPIYKKGDEFDCSNYRPISLIPALSKVVEKILFMQILNFLNKNHLLTNKQFGFTKGLSTTDAILHLTQLIAEGNEDNMISKACFIDLSKAFDTVPHNRLISKLKTIYNFSEKSISLLTSYLEMREQAVLHRNRLSGRLQVQRGVPQGSTLGPLLFLIYINDFPECIEKANVVLFADDTTLIVSEKLPDVASNKLAQAMNTAKTWFSANDLKLNSNKTMFKTFTTNSGITISEEPVRFLGVHLDSRMLWSEQGEYVAAALNRGNYMLRTLKFEVSSAIMRTAYFALFESHLSYAVLAWGHSTIRHRLFRLQRRAIRTMAGLEYRDSCRQAFVDMGILTLPCIYIFECVKYVKLHPERYVQHNMIHSHNTRQGKDICPGPLKLKRSQDGINFHAIKFFNRLPVVVREKDSKTFLKEVRNVLMKNAFYDWDEFMSYHF